MRVRVVVAALEAAAARVVVAMRVVAVVAA
jgi:hypothetical protein